MSEQKSRTVNYSEAMVIARAKSTGAGRRLVGGEWLFSHDELVRFHDLLIATGMSEAATLCEGEAAEYLRNVWPPHEPPQPAEATECRYCDEVMKERDDYHEWADTLAYDIERLVGVEIGEHSNLNSPWGNAHDAAEYELDKRARKPHEPNVVQKIMARLADLLDEDQFKDIEDIARTAGVQYPNVFTESEQAGKCEQPIEPRETPKGPRVAEWPELPSKTNPDILVDERCMDLAKHFLAGGAAILGEPQDCVANRSSLARDIQQAVEDWFLEASLTKEKAL